MLFRGVALAPVPEPGTFAPCGIGLLGLLALHKRSRRLRTSLMPRVERSRDLTGLRGRILRISLAPLRSNRRKFRIGKIDGPVLGGWPQSASRLCDAVLC